MNKSEYSPDWNDIIRPAILRRDGYKCRHCGVKHKAKALKNSGSSYVEVDEFMLKWATTEGRKVVTIYLNVAHLDQDKKNNNPDNLLSLCVSCHSKYDSKFKSIKRKQYNTNVQSSRTRQKIKKLQLKNDLISFVESFCYEYLDLTLSPDQKKDLSKFTQNQLNNF